METEIMRNFSSNSRALNFSLAFSAFGRIGYLLYYGAVMMLFSQFSGLGLLTISK